MSGQVPCAFIHFVEECLVESPVCQFDEEGLAARVRLCPVVETPHRYLMVNSLCFELRLWSVGNHRIHLARQALSELQEQGRPTFELKSIQHLPQCDFNDGGVGIGVAQNLRGV